MDGKSRRQLVVLSALLGVLALVLWWNFAPSAEPVAGSRAARRPAPQAPGGNVSPVARVRLDALAAARPAPEPSERDPFRFGGGFGQGRAPDTEPAVEAAEIPRAEIPPPPPGPPPIPLRFIGVLRVSQGQRLVAVLSDGVGVYRGAEGDIIEGRYRIVRVGLDAVELAYVDGRGQQVIRLSGS